MQIEEFTIVSNPKGDKKTPSIRIRLRHIFRVFSTSYEKRFSIKTTLFACKFKNLLSARTRRGIKKRPLSESAFDTFFVFSRHLMRNVFLSKMTLFACKLKNLLSSRTRRGIKKRPLSESAFDTFFVFSRHLMRNVFLSKRHCLHANSRIYYRLEAEVG